MNFQVRVRIVRQKSQNTRILYCRKIIKEAGGTISHIYTCDTFNENDPSDNSTEFLRDSAKFTYRAMKEADDKAVWLVKQITFINTGKKQVTESFIVLFVCTDDL